MRDIRFEFLVRFVNQPKSKDWPRQPSFHNDLSGDSYTFWDLARWARADRH
jgi:hypothetical protein